MKRNSVVLLMLALALALAGQFRLGDDRITAAPRPTVAPPQEIAWLPRPVHNVEAHTHDDPIHMPDLLGRTLDYAANIWDDDEPLPQIVVERLSAGDDLVIVAQQPAPGVMIVPEHTRITLTLDRGPYTRLAPTPTPTPRVGRAAPDAPPDGAATTDEAPLVTLLRAPYVQRVTPTSLVIVWTTAQNGASVVRYGIDDLSATAAATTTFFTTPAPAPYDQYYVHEATLSGLTPDTLYQYTIFTSGVNLSGDQPVQVRSGKPPSATRFRIGVIGDSGDGSQNQRDVAARLLQIQPDLALHTGDIIYNEATYDGYETKYFQVYQDLLKRVWMAPSLGNHDVTYNNGQSFTDVFVNPPNATAPDERELYYSFDYGNAHITVLNNYFAASTVGSPQYNWLRDDLAATRQFWKFVVFHVPAYTSEGNQAPGDNAKIVQNLVPIFEQYDVDLVLNGHKHWYERMYPLRGGQVTTVAAGGIQYLVTGGGGAGLHAVGSPPLNPRTAVKVSQFHLTMLDVDDCRIQLSAVRKASGPGDAFDPGDIFDSFTIDRCDQPPPSATATAVVSPTPTTPAPTDTAIASATPIPTVTPTEPGSASPTPTAILPLVFSDGFESGDLTQWTGGSGVAVQQQEVFAGAYAARAASANTPAYLYKRFTTQPDVYSRVLFKSISQGSSWVYPLRLQTGGGAQLLGVYLTGGAGSARIGVRNFVTGLSSTSAASVTRGAWHELQVRAQINGALSQIEVWLDGVRLDDLSKIEVLGVAGVGRIQLGENATNLSYDLVFDDVAVATSPLGQNPPPSATPTATPAATATPIATPTVTAVPTVAPSATPSATPTATSAPPRGPLFSDGFESGDLTQWTKASGLVVQQADVYAGSYAAQASGAGTTAYAYKQLSASQSELFLRTRFKLISQGQNSVFLLLVRSATGAAIAGVYVTANGNLGYQNYVVIKGVTSPVTVQRGVWHELQMRIRIDDAASQIEVWLDGAQIPGLSKTDAFGVAPVGRVQIGESLTGRTFDLVFDDVVADSALIAP
jgi:hypothetical protein